MTALEQFILAHIHCLTREAVCSEVWRGHTAGLLHLCYCTAEQTRNGNRTQTRAETSPQLCAPFKYPFKLRRTWFKWYPGLMWVSWTSVFYSKDAFLWKKKIQERNQHYPRCKVARHQLISACFHSTSSDTCTHPPCPHLCCPTRRAKREQGSMASDWRVTWERTPLASCLERKEPRTWGRRLCWQQPAWASSWCCRTPHLRASRVSRVQALGTWSREVPSWESSAQNNWKTAAAGAQWQDALHASMLHPVLFQTPPGEFNR